MPPLEAIVVVAGSLALVSAFSCGWIVSILQQIRRQRTAEFRLREHLAHHRVSARDPGPR